jgi:hypothetical protein
MRRKYINSGVIMEHRYSNRFAFDVNVFIHQNRGPVIVGRIKNGTRFGLFIESDASGIYACQLLDVEVLITKNDYQPQRYKIPSIVTHTTDQGFGVEFDPVDGEVSDQLYDVLCQMHIAPKHLEFMDMRASA